MPAIDHIRGFHDELTRIRRDIHANPEIGMEEWRTSELVAEKLAAWGIEVHRNVGKTGVVGVLRVGNGARTIGLRADMDALPIVEANEFAHRSRHEGLMHACGHDGHTTMLLGAARYLAETRDFDGTVTFIFQPGEEGRGGALAMLADGLFERFPCETVFGMHNRPGMTIGRFGIAPGPYMAGAATFDIIVTGRGGHGAMPHHSVDPVLAACHIGTALQSIVARNVPASARAVLSVTRIAAGEAYNVIPETATLAGTARAMTRETMTLLETAMKRLVPAIAAGFGATALVTFETMMTALVNSEAETDAIAAAATELVGEEHVNRANASVMGSEDFAFMLEKVAGAYIHLGNGDSRPVHNHRYDFNDAAIPYGAALYARLVERQLAKGRS
ncbi:MAG: amidohydrolase [Acetobacteraceae bacterium]|nr:amidohydrolase [Acetobacteraceae bacterium]